MLPVLVLALVADVLLLVTLRASAASSLYDSGRGWYQSAQYLQPKCASGGPGHGSSSMGRNWELPRGGGGEAMGSSDNDWLQNHDAVLPCSSCKLTWYNYRTYQAPSTGGTIASR